MFLNSGMMIQRDGNIAGQKQCFKMGCMLPKPIPVLPGQCLCLYNNQVVNPYLVPSIFKSTVVEDLFRY